MWQQYHTNSQRSKHLCLESSHRIEYYDRRYSDCRSGITYHLFRNRNQRSRMYGYSNKGTSDQLISNSYRGNLNVCL